MATAPAPHRLVALDWMRGVVMVLMAIDHASVIYNPDRVAADSAALYLEPAALPTLDFLTRWITHLCAPTFLFLAGAGVALGSARRLAKDPDAGRAIDRDLLIRGALLIVFDLTYLSALVGYFIFQVLYAIGLSMILMVPLRRLEPRLLAALALLWFAGGEALTALVWQPPSPPPSMLARLTLAPHYGAALGEGYDIIYPALPWLAMMMLGWAFGAALERRRERGAPPPITALLAAGLGSLALFALIRGLNGYGNMFLLRADGSWTQWLHVSKYPPSASFAALELGLLFLALAALMVLERRVEVRDDGPLMVYGQTALFFYLVHWLVLAIPALALGRFGAGSLAEAYLATIVTLALMYPLCRWFRRRKRARPRSWIRYI